MSQKDNQKEQSASKGQAKPTPKAAKKKAGAAPTKAPASARSKLSLLSLESRLMFDAAAAATAAEVNQEQVAQEQAEAAVSAGGSSEPTAAETESQELLQAIASYHPGESTTEIVFVDPTVPDYQDLLNGMDPNIEVIMLDAGKDGVQQMASALVGRTGIDAIHVISHGGAGELHLGTGTLSLDTMAGQYADELAAIKLALSEQADIMIYGCDFAEGEVGQATVDQLAALTGADVAASTDLTGAASLGGDWVLETQTGLIESHVVVTDQAQAAYGGVLDITTGLVGQWTFDANANDSSGNNYNGTLTNGATINTSTATNMVGAGKLSLDGTNDHVDLSAHLANFSGLTQGTISAWIRTSTTGEGTIVSADDTAFDSAYTALFVYQNKLNFWVANGGTYLLRAQSTVSVNDGNWHHVAVTVDATGNKLFIDGVQAAVTYSTGSAVTQGFFANVSSLDFMGIGIDKDNGGLNAAMPGLIDDVRVYNRALTSGDMAQLYGTSNDAPINSVPAAQSTNEDTTLVFSSGNGNQISITDPDNSGASFEATIAVTNGTLTLSGTTGLTFTTGDGSADNTMTFRGTAANINTALNGLSFAPTANYNGGATLTVTSLDNTLVSLNIDANLQARYTFEGNATDVAPGTAQNGTLVGNATYTTDATRGQVLTLDGSGDYVQITGTYSNPTEVTIGGWVNLAAGTGRKEFISLSDRVHIALDDAAGVKGSIQTGAGSWIDLNSNQFIAGTGWHHVMYTYSDSGNVHRLYIDGALVASATNNSSIYWTGAGDTYIGHHSVSGNNPNALVDDVRIYNRSLTATEIANLARDLALTDTDTVVVTVTAVNDAPVLDNSGTMTLTSITEVDTSNSGQTVASIIASAGGDRITDADSGASEGIAVTFLNSGSGTWQYNTGSGWTNVGTVSESSALLLRSTDSLRFVPNGTGADSGSITFRAWDQTSGTAGTKVATGTTSTVLDQFGSTSFSNNNGTQNWAGAWIETDAGGSGPSGGSIQISSSQLRFDADTIGDNIAREVNLNGTTGATLSFSYNNTLTGADRVEIRVSSNGGASYTTLTNGVFSGSLRTGSGSASFDISAYASSNTRIQFIVTGTGGNDRFYVDNVQISSSAISATGAFSTAMETASITVTAVNDAPVLADTALSITVAEDAGVPSGAVGSLVSAFTGGITDVDSGASKGIAITGSNETNGTWYYTTNGGTTWTAVGTVSNTSALLLADNANTRLYFAPSADYNGTSTAALTVRAWDQTSGTAGTKVSAASNGGTTAFSSATDTVDVSVTAVNDAPVLADTALSMTVAEDAGAPSGAVGSLISAFTGGITDVDSGASKGIAITGSNETNGTWYYTTNGGTTWTAIGTVSNTSALLLADNGSTRLYFAPNANYNGTSTAALTVRAWDQTSGTAGTKVSTASNGGTTAFSSATDTVNVSVTATNDAPVNAVPTTQTTAFNTPLTLSGASAISVSDVDSNPLQVTLTAANGTVTLSGTAGLTFSSGDGTADATMTFTGTGANINAALNGLVFTPTANFSGTTSLTVDTSDLGGAPLGVTTVLPSTSAAAQFDKQQVGTQLTFDSAGTVANLNVYMDNSKANVVRVGLYTDVAGEPGTLLAETSATLPIGSGWYTLDIPDVAVSAGNYWLAVAPGKEGTLYYSATGGNTRFSNYDPKNGMDPSWTVGDTYQSNTWQVSAYAGFTASGSTALTDTDSVTIVVGTNTAPGLDATKSPVLTAQNEDAGAPSGVVGTLVSSLVDFASPSGQVDNVTDPNGGALLGIAITAADTFNGTWYYSTDNGTTWNSLGAVATNSAQLLAADANTRLYFQPNANYNGTVANAITFRAWDQTSGTNGGMADTSSNGGTTAFSAATDTASLTVTSVNDAPVLADTALSITVAEDAGAPSGAVGSLVSAFTGGITDVDASAVKGLAITGSVETNGTWYYTTNGGTTWTAVGTVSNTSALLLADNANTRLYFAPSADYNGTSSAALTVRAWDQTSGTAGTKVTTASNGGTTAFSSATDTIDVSVTAVNDAPTIGGASLTSITEDTTNPAGQTISALIGGTFSDPDAGASLAGILVTHNPENAAQGTWQYSTDGGTNWYNVGTIAYPNSLALAASASIRFVPAADYNGSPDVLSFRGLDNSYAGGFTSGATKVTADASSPGGTSSISSSLVSFGTVVSPVNDAPVLADTALSITVAEDAGAPSGAVGSLVSAFTGGITDVDSGASKGIAITGSNETNGTWYYTTNGGTTWTAVGTVSNTSALLLADNGSTRLYFAPNADYSGTSSAALTVRAWDQTSGTAGTKVTAASNGGTTAFSSATDTIDVTVTAINDAPVITGLAGDSLAYTEGSGAQFIEQWLDANVTDIDSTDFAGGTLTVSFVAGSDSAEDVLAVFNQGSAAGQIGVSGSNITYGGVTIGSFTGGSGGAALVITFNSNATPARVSTLVNLITYENTDTAAPTTGTRTVRYVLTDGDGGTSLNYDATVTVSGVNDAPVLADTALSITVAEDAGAPSGAVGSTISAFTGGITEPDGGTTKGLAITGSNETNGTWYYTTNGGTTWTAVGSVSNTSALLLADNVNTRLYFAPSADYNGTSTAALTVRAWDQTSGTAGTKVTTASNGGTTAFSSATDTIDVSVTAVNDAPVITPIAPDVTFVEGGMAQLIDATGTVADVDSANFDGGVMTVSISINGTVDDRLIVGNWGTGPGQVGVSGSNVTYEGTVIGTMSGGTSGSDPLVITFNTNATPTAVQEVYRSLQFNNVSENPSTATRTLTIGVTDGDGGTATPQTKLVYVQGTNDAPVLTFGEGDKNFTEGALAVMIDALPNVSDLDSTNFDTGTLTITISANPSVDDRVELLNTGMGAGQIGVSGTNVYYGGTLIGTQAGGIGAVPFVVTFNANADAAIVGEVMANIRFWVAGDAPSTATRTIEAVLTDGDGGTSLTASKQITVTAVNDPTVITGGTSGSGAEDSLITNTLTATDAEGLSDGTVFTVSANASNGTASIDPATGLWSYTPNADWNGTDSFTVTITDDAGNSTTQVISVTVTPVVDITNDSLTTNEDTAISANVLTGTNGATADTFEGTPVLTSVTQGTNGTVTFLANGTVTYTPNANFNGTDSFTYTITSGGVTETATVTVTVNAVNDPTVVTGGTSGTGTEDTTITNTLTATDVEGLSDGTVFTVSANASNGTASIDPATGLWSYTPNADWNGTDSFTVTITDDAGNTATQVISVSVTPVVDITNDSLTTNEDTAISANVLTGTNGATADTFEGTPVLTSVTQGANGSVTFLSNGTVTYTPNANFNGTDSFTYTITSGGVTETATVTVNVTAVNDPTIITGGTSGSGAEDSLITNTLTATDVEGLSDGSVFTVSANATNGTASIDPATGLWSYTPNADFNGTDSFTVTIADDAGNTATQVISVSVTPVVDITNDSLTTNEDTAISANVLTGTNGATADTFEGTPVLTSVTQGTNGTVTFLANGTVTYTPNANFNGTDSFTYTITSGGVTETATVTVTVNAVNDPTVVTGGTSGTGTEDTTITNTLTATDVEGLSDGTVFTVSATATNGTASINPATGLWSYTPNADFNGSDSFTVTITDDAGNTATQVISVTVTPVVDITDDSLTTNEDSAISANVLTGTNGATADSFEGTPTLTSVTQGANGSVTFLANGTVTYTPNANFNGTDSFTYTITSGGVTETATVTVTVNAVNDPTVVTGGTSGTGTEDTTITNTLTATDVEGLSDGTVFSVTGAATNGTASIDPATGLWSYTPNADFNGSDSFTVTITDDAGNTATQVISVTVSPVADITNDSLTTNEDTAISANVLTGTMGATADTFEGTPVLTSVTQGANGSVTFLANGTVTYTPNANFNGTDSFTYTITSGGVTETATVTVTVNAVNDPTVVTGGTSGSGSEDTVITNTLTATDAEGLSDGSVFTVTTDATNGTASIDPATGLWSYTPNADFNGTDSFTVTITDDAGNTATQVISVTVTPVNDAPLLVANTGSTVAEGGTDTISSGELAVTDIEQVAAQLTYSIGTGPAHGQLELTTAPGVSATTFTQDDIAANRLIYIHDGSETTSDSFIFTVNDGGGGSLGPTTVTLTITPVNDTPTISSDGGGAIASLNVAENVNAVTIVTGADVDLPAQALSYSISGGVDQALFTINTTTGDLSFTAPPDFEVATDANGDNVYVVQVQVVDSQGASTTQTIQVTVTDVMESVAQPPVVPPILLTPTPPPPSGGPSSGPGTPPTTSAPTPADSSPAPAPAAPGPTGPFVDGRPSVQGPFIPVTPPDRSGVKPLEELKPLTAEPSRDQPIFLINDDQGRPLFSVLPVEPAPTLEPDPPEPKASVSDLLMTKLDEMAVALEEAVNVSQERHELMARVAAVTGTTLSVGFVAWALRSGAILASMLATMPAWQHFDPLPVVKLTRNERKHRRDEATRVQQEEAVEFKGLGRVLDEQPPLKRTA